MKSRIIKLIQKYNITAEKIIIAAFLLLIIIARFLSQNSILIKPIQTIYDLYGKILISNSKLLLSFSDVAIIFDYAKNQLICPDQVLTINRYFFSINQIVAIIILILLNKSPYRSKMLFFLAGLAIFTLYDSIRISLHAILPGTNYVHNWISNLILMPRWLLVLLITYLYWKKYVYIKETLKKKFNFSERFITLSFLKIALIIISYYIIIVIIFNNYFIASGDALVGFILNASKYVLGLSGYESLIRDRYLYGSGALLYMDDACLGIDLMFLFAAFIVLMPGPVKHKLWFIPSGIIVIILLNCLRIILIFIHIAEHKTYQLPLEIHDLFTYPVLVFTFFMWYIWLNKFFVPQKVQLKV